MQILIVLEAFGMGLVILPGRAAEYAAQDAWLVSAVFAVMACVAALLLTAVGRRFPNDRFLCFTGRVLSKPVAYLLAVGLAVKLILGAAMSLRLFALAAKSFLLNHTPTAAVCALMVGIAAYAAAKGIEARARIGEILFFVIIPPMLILFLLAFFNIDCTNLMPVRAASPGILVRGAFWLGPLFIGLESLLLVFPYVNCPNPGRRTRPSGTPPIDAAEEPQNSHAHEGKSIFPLTKDEGLRVKPAMTKEKAAARKIIAAVAFAGILIVLITALCVAKFGYIGLVTTQWPLLRMMDMIALPGALIERQGALVLSFWIVTVFLSVNSALFFGAELAKDITHRGQARTHVMLCGVTVFLLACLPLEAETILRWMDGLYVTFGIFYWFIFPVVFLTAARLRGFKPPEKQEAEA